MDRQRRKGSARLSNSSSPSLNELLEMQVSRRHTLRGGLGLAASTVALFDWHARALLEVSARFLSRQIQQDG